MYNKRLLLALILLTLMLMALAGCLQESAVPQRAATSIVLPEGDHEAGRRAFTSLGCALCHQAAGDRGMPEPATATQGPVIGPAQSGQSTELLVESILDPSHRIPESLEFEGISPMVDYSDITIRQLSDVVAYIRYMSE